MLAINRMLPGPTIQVNIGRVRPADNNATDVRRREKLRYLSLLSRHRRSSSDNTIAKRLTDLTSESDPDDGNDKLLLFRSSAKRGKSWKKRFYKIKK
jgi:hypothetical protein